jgi:hypothetical protein
MQRNDGAGDKRVGKRKIKSVEGACGHSDRECRAELSWAGKRNPVDSRVNKARRHARHSNTPITNHHQPPFVNQTERSSGRP